MWEKFKQALGKFVQKLFKKNKSKNIQECSFTIYNPDCINETITWVGEPGLVECFKGIDNTLEFYLNTPRTLLPKRYRCETLLISCYGHWDFDSTGMDISCLESDGIAHYWITSVESLEEFDGEEEIHSVVSDVWLLEFEDGSWTWEFVNPE